MWLVFKVVVVATVVLIWIFIQSSDHCPSCGIELAESADMPGERVDFCVCGWRARR